jgi:hypothetical protein
MLARDFAGAVAVTHDLLAPETQPPPEGLTYLKIEVGGYGLHESPPLWSIHLA